MQKATEASQEAGGSGSAGHDGLRQLVLVRIASAAMGSSRADIASDLAPIGNPGLPVAQWQAEVDRHIQALAGTGLAMAGAARIEVK